MKPISHIIKKEVEKLKRKNFLTENRFNYLRLDNNERILPLKKNDLKSFKLSIKEDDIMGYTEIYSTYKNLAKFLKVDINQLLIAAGSDLAIKTVFETFIKKGDSVVLQSPSYAMSQVYAKMFGAKIKFYKADKNFAVKSSNIYKQIDRKTKLVIIENPSGFIGSFFKKEEIAKFARNFYKKNILLLVDEAYFYVENNNFDKNNLLKKYPNLIISQTFSKGHGLAGARFGYLISNSKIMNFLKKVRPMHEISGLTAKAANWVFKKPHMHKEFQKSIKLSKQYLMKELLLLKIKYRMTKANYFLIYAPNFGKTKDVTKKLKQKKILIRRPFDQKELKGWIRVTVGGLSDSKKFIFGLKSIIKR